MRKLFVIAVIALVACSKSKIDQAITEAEDFKTRMCACPEKDQACAQAIAKEFHDWQTKLKATISEDEKAGMAKEQKQRFSAVLKDMDRCGKARAGQDVTKVDDMLDKLAELRDKMCACKDKACVDAIQKEMGMWTASQWKDAGKLKLSDDDQKRMTEISAKMSECGAAASK